MAWQIETVETWSHLTDVIERLEIHKRGDLLWLLRGQANHDWGLIPSLTRCFAGRQVSRRKAHGMEESARRKFEGQAHLHLGPAIVQTGSWSQFKWWMLMQHYGCPTRLLDWSQSPYVALYFAVDQLPDCNGALWIIRGDEVDSLMDQRHGGIVDVIAADGFSQESADPALFPIFAHLHTERSVAQQGACTVCTDLFSDHADVLDALFAKGAECDALRKVIIPAGLKHEFLSRLRCMNITASALFPGIDGMGKAAGEYVRQRLWRETRPR